MNADPWSDAVHLELLADGDEVAAREISRQVLRELGYATHIIDAGDPDVHWTKGEGGLFTGSAASGGPVPELRVKTLGNVASDAVTAVKSDLTHLPISVARTLAQQDTVVTMCERLTDHPAFAPLATSHPPGWPSFVEYQDLHDAANAERHEIVIATSGLSGSVSPVLYWAMHLYDLVSGDKGWPLSASVEFGMAYRADRAVMDPFFAARGGTGRQAAFAEGAAMYLLGRQKDDRAWPHVAEYFRRRFGARNG